MIGASCKAVFSSLFEIIMKVFVYQTGTFCGFDHNEPDGVFIYHSIVTKFVPVNLSLMMRDVDTVNFITFRVIDVTIECTPSEAEGPNKDIVEKPNIRRYK